MPRICQRFLADESGATAIEYCFIASLVAIALVTGLTSVGVKLKQYFQQVAAVN